MLALFALIVGVAAGGGITFLGFRLRSVRKKLLALQGSPELEKARLALKEANSELAEERKKLRDTETILADVLDAEGKVRGQLRLPGSLPKKPTTTPCGRLCNHAHFISSGKKVGASNTWSHGSWVCKAAQGIDCDEARDRFLDNENQCVMFERKKND